MHRGAWRCEFFPCWNHSDTGLFGKGRPFRWEASFTRTNSKKLGRDAHSICEGTYSPKLPVFWILCVIKMLLKWCIVCWVGWTKTGNWHFQIKHIESFKENTFKKVWLWTWSDVRTQKSPGCKSPPPTKVELSRHRQALRHFDSGPLWPPRWHFAPQSSHWGLAERNGSSLHRTPRQSSLCPQCISKTLFQN